MIIENLTVAEYVAKFIETQDVPAVFQLSGGMIAYLTDRIENLGKTPLIHNRHEQAAGFAAEGSTRSTGRPSIAMGTSGPGATNLITPIASCFYDSTPVVFITGQVRTDEIKKSELQRQNGFQELDICAIAAPITKKTWQVTLATQVPEILEEAWRLATSGRPGPVLIDLPIDIQQIRISAPIRKIEDLESSLRAQTEDVTQEVIESIRATITNAKNPLVLVGGGVRSSGSVQDLHRFLEKSQLPHVSTLMGIDACPHESRNYLGFIGSYGNSWANEALSSADVLLVLGSRLDVRQTGADIKGFKHGKTIIRIDIDESELGGRVDSDLPVLTNLRDFFLKMHDNEFFAQNSVLVEQVQENKKRNPQNKEQTSQVSLNPNDVLSKISSTFKGSNGYVVDVGQHQMWAAQSLNLERSQRFITSGGLGAMGFALPASIGAAIAIPGEWVAIIGDGCIQLSIQELQTISQYNLPIVVCVINNNQHGMVAQFQEEHMNSRFIGTRKDYSNPNYSRVAEAFGIKNYISISSFDDLASLDAHVANFEPGPAIIEFVISQNAKALPKMKFVAQE